MARLNYTKISPEGFQALGTVMELAAKTIDKKLRSMVYLHISQINGCPYCVDLHWREATAAGADARTLNAISIWRDAPFFSEKERASLEWAECVTTMIDQDTMGGAFENARKHFSEKEMVDFTFAIVQMNAFNKLGIAFHATPKK